MVNKRTILIYSCIAALLMGVWVFSGNRDVSIYIEDTIYFMNYSTIAQFLLILLVLSIFVRIAFRKFFPKKRS